MNSPLPMLTLSPARLETSAQRCIQEFHQFGDAQLVILALDQQGELLSTVRLCQAPEQLCSEQLLGYLHQARAVQAVLACQCAWPLQESNPMLKQLSQLLERCYAEGIELLNCFCIEGQNAYSMRAETDLWYAVC